jgi:peptidoglycan hydrolase FlgJ
MNILSTLNSPQKIENTQRSGGEQTFIPLKSQENPHAFKINQPHTAIPISKESQKSFPINRKAIPIKKSAPQSPEKISAQKSKLKKSAEGFEAIFIRQLLSTMRATIPEGGMLGSGMAGDIYGDIINNAMSETMSKKSAFGLADIIYSRLVKTIETGNAPSAVERKPETQGEDEK